MRKTNESEQVINEPDGTVRKIVTSVNQTEPDEDINSVLDALSKLTQEEMQAEKGVWFPMLEKLMGADRKISKVEFPVPGEKQVKISYKPEIIEGECGGCG